MKTFTALLLLSLSSFSVSATIMQEYIVQQETLTTVIASKTGLTKASCVFYNEQGEQPAGQNVIVNTDYLEQGLNVIQVNLYAEMHNDVVTIKCK
ncbi:hypothetical protein VP277E431_P0148 [Vibrio phage 277E43-1]|nr:hypothetical protein VP277E431_P0148 [Vibrio phage 277E43-1]